jgi:hypothetical protein
MAILKIDTEAGRVSEELVLRGVPAEALVHVIVDLAPKRVPDPLVALAEAGKAFEFLGDEADLYSDSDIVGPAR